jgi:hypothetical protein
MPEDVDRLVDAWGRLYVRTRRAAADAVADRREAARLLLSGGSRHK